MFLCVCTCVCVFWENKLGSKRERERERERKSGYKQTQFVLISFTFLSFLFQLLNKVEETLLLLLTRRRRRTCVFMCVLKDVLCMCLSVAYPTGAMRFNCFHCLDLNCLLRRMILVTVDRQSDRDGDSERDSKTDRSTDKKRERV